MQIGILVSFWFVNYYTILLIDAGYVAILSMVCITGFIIYGILMTASIRPLLQAWKRRKEKKQKMALEQQRKDEERRKRQEQQLKEHYKIRQQLYQETPQHLHVDINASSEALLANHSRLMVVSYPDSVDRNEIITIPLTLDLSSIDNSNNSNNNISAYNISSNNSNHSNNNNNNNNDSNILASHPIHQTLDDDSFNFKC